VLKSLFFIQGPKDKAETDVKNESNEKKCRPIFYILTIIFLALAVLGLSIALAFVTGCFQAAGKVHLSSMSWSCYSHFNPKFSNYIFYLHTMRSLRGK
jgi:hypothetical protein